jgi:hypothetical protein
MNFSHYYLLINYFQLAGLLLPVYMLFMVPVRKSGSVFIIGMCFFIVAGIESVYDYYSRNDGKDSH